MHCDGLLVRTGQLTAVWVCEYLTLSFCSENFLYRNFAIFNFLMAISADQYEVFSLVLFDVGVRSDVMDLQSGYIRFITKRTMGSELLIDFFRQSFWKRFSDHI